MSVDALTRRLPLHARALPALLTGMLASPPESGVHTWIFRCACLLKPWRDDDEAIRIISQAAERCRRRVPASEIKDAVRLAQNDWKPDFITEDAGHTETPSVPLTPPPPRVVRDYNPEVLTRFAEGCPTAPSPELMREISWVPLPDEDDQRATTRLFLETCFNPGDRVLIFTDHRSQGDFGYIVGRGCWKLGAQEGDPPTPAELPTSGPCGVWFLNNPVTGRWTTNDCGRLSRRSHQNVTSWRHLVLESDTAPTDQWLKALVRLPLSIVAIYTSGGRSIHALVRIDADDKAAADAAAAVLKDRLSPLGADPAALTSVRLSRLPGTHRCGSTDDDGKHTAYDQPRLQRLLWLAETPAEKSISGDLQPF